MQKILFNNLFHKNTGDSSNRIFLEELAKGFPYFSPLHYFLLNETESSDSSYGSIASKTVLHFNDALHLHFLIHQGNNPAKPEDKVETQENPIVTAISPETSLPVTQEKEELLFEPLFTSDYFASQGIKLSEETPSNDQLGKQLKSFTAWLKTMKKVHGNKPPESAAVDTHVEKMAENSNQNTEIITEAMAEIYQKQGKIDKAEAIFQKLSLQNPSKSVYFANKIEQLKAI